MCSVKIYILYLGSGRWAGTSWWVGWHTSPPCGSTPEALFPVLTLSRSSSYDPSLRFHPHVLCNRCHDLYSKGHFNVCVCVHLFLLPDSFPVHVCERFSEDLLCTSPSQGSPVGISRYRVTLMCQFCLKEWMKCWWNTVTHPPTHPLTPTQNSPRAFLMITVHHTQLTFFLKANL